MNESVYQRHEDIAPDSDFEPGALHHLVVGNRGRMLDPRRTPVTVVGLRPERGTFVLRIDGFEDRGAVWELPGEKVDRCQFAKGSPRLAGEALRAFQEAVARFEGPMTVPCSPAARVETEKRIAEETRAAAAWLQIHSSFFGGGGALPDPDSLVADPRLGDDLGAFMAQRGLAEIEGAFATQFVRNPASGELVKGHRIVIADLGLVPYEGSVVRDPGLFDGLWSRERRAEHVVCRLAFVRAFLARFGLERVTLYRGMTTDEPLRGPKNHTFVSATFSRRVAESHFDAAGPPSTSVLYRQSVPPQRVFMTYLETAQMNRQFKEAEAVLFYEPENPVF